MKENRRNFSGNAPDTKLHSKVDRGGDKKSTQAYI